MESCIICLSSIYGSQYECRMCGSAFHNECWTKWMTVGKGCPHCRHCAQNEFLKRLIPDVPHEVSESLTSYEKFILCKLAVLSIILTQQNFDHLRNI